MPDAASRHPSEQRGPWGTAPAVPPRRPDKSRVQNLRDEEVDAIIELADQFTRGELSDRQLRRQIALRWPDSPRWEEAIGVVAWRTGAPTVRMARAEQGWLRRRQHLAKQRRSTQPPKPDPDAVSEKDLASVGADPDRLALLTIRQRITNSRALQDVIRARMHRMVSEGDLEQALESALRAREVARTDPHPFSAFLRKKRADILAYLQEQPTAHRYWIG